MDYRNHYQTDSLLDSSEYIEISKEEWEHHYNEVQRRILNATKK